MYRDPFEGAGGKQGLPRAAMQAEASRPGQTCEGGLQDLAHCVNI